MVHDVAIIGAGPAGIAASIYLKRAGFDIILYEKKEIGGLLLNAHIVENYPGFPEGVEGKHLCQLMKKQLEKWKIKPLEEEVTKVKIKNKQFALKTQKNEKTFKTVIIATGTIPKEITTPIEKKLVGKQVFYEIKNILNKIKPGKKCIIIGGGDAAFDYSLNLADKKIKVYLFLRSKKPKCLPLLYERAKKHNMIQIYPSHNPHSICKINGKPEVKFRYNRKNTKYSTDFVLISCGRKPNNDLLKDITKKNISGVYIAGDVKTGKYRQTGIAVGEGIYSAMKTEQYLRGK